MPEKEINVNASTWERMDYWTYVCGRCGKGLLIRATPDNDAFAATCQTNVCPQKGLVAKFYPPNVEHSGVEKP